jgi:hypothetical protein
MRTDNNRRRGDARALSLLFTGCHPGVSGAPGGQPWQRPDSALFAQELSTFATFRAPVIAR